MFMFLSHAIFQFLDSISSALDPVEWIFNTGKELERSCDFAMALKYYFAGRMFFARLEHARQSTIYPVTEQLQELLKKWDTHKYKQEFQALYVDLLPMTNAQVCLRNGNETRSHSFYFLNTISQPLPTPCTQAYTNARESVHYQKVVLKRGTMNK